MKNNIFRKKFNDLGPNVSDKIDEIFEGETKSDTEFVAKFKSLSSKARKKAIQIAGAGLVSLLVLSGFTGCVDKQGNITETEVTTESANERGDILNNDPTLRIATPIPYNYPNYYPEALNNFVHDAIAENCYTIWPPEDPHSNEAEFIADTKKANSFLSKVIYVEQIDHSKEPTKDLKCDFYIYARHERPCNNTRHYTQTGFTFEDKSIVEALADSTRWSSYEDWLEYLIKAIEENGVINTYSTLSKISAGTDRINAAGGGYNLAKKINDEFWNIDLICETPVGYDSRKYDVYSADKYTQLVGFAYDDEYNCYFVKIHFKNNTIGYSATYCDSLIEYKLNGTLPNITLEGSSEEYIVLEADDVIETTPLTFRRKDPLYNQYKEEDEQAQ